VSVDAAGRLTAIPGDFRATLASAL
jgi:hypothetical protein